MLLTDKLHIEDMLEIGIRGVEIDGEEYFIHSYLKKEMLSKLRRKFLLRKDIGDSGDQLAINKWIHK